jgi:homocysteine S-methyltransferase
VTLPQLDGQVILTDGGVETTLIFVDGFELPEFASFPLVERDDGREALRRYFRAHLDVARRHGTGFLLEAPTWRANTTWGAKLGYSESALAEANRRALAFCSDLAADEEFDGPIVRGAQVGPQGDAYSGVSDTAEWYADLHRAQLRVLADAGVELVSALTIPSVEEGIGVVRAAAEERVPVALSFTVETDGRLPTGQPLGEAFDQVDAETNAAASYFMVNCAHPTHIARGLATDGPWERVLGIRANASSKSHAELDESTELDDGDPVELAADYVALREQLSDLTLLGGCCGTDQRHLAAIADAWL